MAAIAYFIDVGGSEALLNRDVARVRRALFAEEVRHELLHAGCGQQHCRIVDRDQARGRLNVAAAVLPEFDKGGANLVARARRHDSGVSFRRTAAVGARERCRWSSADWTCDGASF